MPSVSVLPSSPAPHRPLGSPRLPIADSDDHNTRATKGEDSFSNHIGSGNPELTVEEIKRGVHRDVNAVRTASAISLLRTAKDRAVSGHNLEVLGDLRGAYKALLTCAELINVVLAHPEFKAETAGGQGKKGVVWNEWNDFQKHYGTELLGKTKDLETKLLGMEADRKTENGRKPGLGSSIADRIKSLQDTGLKVQTAKRLSRDFSNSTANPSISASVASSNAISRSFSQNTNGIIANSNSDSSSITNHRTGSSTQSLSSPSIQPPSPGLSQTQSSDILSLGGHYPTLSEFNQAFPSIDELDEGTGMRTASGTTLPQLPSVPTNKPDTPAITTNSTSFPPSTVQRFPSLPPLDLDPGPRPASTPISSSTTVLTSSPPSPSRIGGAAGIVPSSSLGLAQTLVQGQRSPLSPTIPPKPANLSMSLTGSSSSASASRTSPMHTGDSSSRNGRGIQLPKTNSVSPKMLSQYLSRECEAKVLLLDIRTRDEFVKCHIKSGEIVCLEPHVLLRDGLTAERLEDSLAVAPSHESALFRNRGKFDLVVMYDWDSETFGSSGSPLATATRVIYETAFKHSLKRPPVILVGGLKAWMASYPTETTREDGGTVTQVDLNLDILKISGSSSTPIAYGNSKGLSFTSAYMQNGQSQSPVPAQEARLPTSHSRSPFPMDQIPEDARHVSFLIDVSSSSLLSVDITSCADDVSYSSLSTEVNSVAFPDASRRLVRKPAITRPPSQSSISFNIRGLYDTSPLYTNGALTGSSSSIAYPQYPRPSSSVSNFSTNQTGAEITSPPPTASINQSLSRRRSDYVDQSEQAISSFTSRPSIDYPDLSSQQVVRPPPAVATPPSERQDHRRATAAASASHGGIAGRSSLSLPEGAPRAPMIDSDYPVRYWLDSQLSTSGLKNLGNTCYMNSTIQCLSATVPFARFFTDGRWKGAVNFVNPLGSKGRLTAAFASILHDLWHQESPTITPYAFRKSICMYGQQFAGSEQHDSQEFLNFLLDGLHEDLNRILNKAPVERPPEREAELEALPQQIASQQEWNLYRRRDDSIVVDFFQGQFRNRMECMTCRKTSTTYNSFMYLTLPIPSAKSKVTLQQCLDAFVQEEVMEKEDAWQCPNCKTLRKATKKLSISRLPPVLLIHLKRFTTKGHFTDKLETFVDFPLSSLDLTNYMPPPLPPGADRKSTEPISLDDPRSQIPPYRYDLYAVTNHFGTLSSGHYTAFVKSRGNWLYCDDSRISNADAREVVGKPAYVLYYKRIKA